MNNNIADLKRELAERNAEIERNKIEIKTIQGRLSKQERWRENAVEAVQNRLEEEINQKEKVVEKSRLEAKDFRREIKDHLKTISYLSHRLEQSKVKLHQEKENNAPLVSSINNLTSERSRFLRKIKRFENSKL